jgi:hypothetical protein
MYLITVRNVEVFCFKVGDLLYDVEFNGVITDIWFTIDGDYAKVRNLRKLTCT